MAEGRGRLEWAQTAEVLCVLYNVHRDRKERSKPFTADEFNPYLCGRQRRRPGMDDKADLALLRGALGATRGRRRP